MKNQVSTPVSQAESGSTWLERENHFMSSLMEESITNAQMLMIIQALLSFSVLSCSVFLTPLAAFVCLVWFILSLRLCKEGGLK
ncbi:hypothetical protein [Phocaeicola plebeius]|uniref:hypothetical protein n=1 Tax=Phocaeicola plebeius TaxID=310297 RepID=UPI002011DAF4|nr:hypothetical protein [Phocaeicola plebeius]MCL1613136.1 hypothetical protein [Phocaeicola plebeius]